MWFGEPHPSPKTGSPTRLSMSGQTRYIGWSLKCLLWCDAMSSSDQVVRVHRIIVCSDKGTMMLQNIMHTITRHHIPDNFILQHHASWNSKAKNHTLSRHIADCIFCRHSVAHVTVLCVVTAHITIWCSNNMTTALHSSIQNMDCYAAHRLLKYSNPNRSALWVTDGERWERDFIVASL